jgi:hypothetical protein
MDIKFSTRYGGCCLQVVTFFMALNLIVGSWKRLQDCTVLYTFYIKAWLPQKKCRVMFIIWPNQSINLNTVALLPRRVKYRTGKKWLMHIPVGVVEPEPHHFGGTGAITRCLTTFYRNFAKIKLTNYDKMSNSTIIIQTIILSSSISWNCFHIKYIIFCTICNR